MWTHKPQKVEQWAGWLEKTGSWPQNKLVINTENDIIKAIANEQFTRLKPFAMQLCWWNEVDAEDLCQETIIRIITKKDSFQPWTNIRARTTTIMRNVFINEYRKKKKGQTIDLDQAAYLPSATVSAESKMNEKQLRDYIWRLKDDHSIVFILKYQWFSYEEIADKLSIPLWTVKSRIFLQKRNFKSWFVMQNEKNSLCKYWKTWVVIDFSKDK